MAKSRRVVLPVELTLDHVLRLGGDPDRLPAGPRALGRGRVYFGDGGLRLVTPFSPAIRLGAIGVLAIGIRSQRAADALPAPSCAAPRKPARPARVLPPPLAQICGVFLNAIFLDHLDTDLDHLRRMNELIGAYGERQRPSRAARRRASASRCGIVTPLVVSPRRTSRWSRERFAHRMPRLVRYVMDGLGTPDAQSADLMSYLLFDAAYTRALLDIGYRDADARIDEIEAFLRARPVSLRGSAASARSMRRGVAPQAG